MGAREQFLARDTHTYSHRWSAYRSAHPMVPDKVMPYAGCVQSVGVIIMPARKWDERTFREKSSGERQRRASAADQLRF